MEVARAQRGPCMTGQIHFRPAVPATAWRGGGNTLEKTSLLALRRWGFCDTLPGDEPPHARAAAGNAAPVSVGLARAPRPRSGAHPAAGGVQGAGGARAPRSDRRRRGPQRRRGPRPTRRSRRSCASRRRTGAFPAKPPEKTLGPPKFARAVATVRALERMADFGLRKTEAPVARAADPAARIAGQRGGHRRSRARRDA